MRIGWIGRVGVLFCGIVLFCVEGLGLVVIAFVWVGDFCLGCLCVLCGFGLYSVEMSLLEV